MTTLNSSGLEYLGSNISTFYSFFTAEAVELEGSGVIDLSAFISLGREAILFGFLVV